VGWITSGIWARCTPLIGLIGPVSHIGRWCDTFEPFDVTYQQLSLSLYPLFLFIHSSPYLFSSSPPPTAGHGAQWHHSPSCSSTWKRAPWCEWLSSPGADGPHREPRLGMQAASCICPAKALLRQNYHQLLRGIKAGIVQTSVPHPAPLAPLTSTMLSRISLPSAALKHKLFIFLSI
jgi:hypothetical protein